jgi:hypothetical protein
MNNQLFVLQEGGFFKKKRLYVRCLYNIRNLLPVKLNLPMVVLLVLWVIK